LQADLSAVENAWAACAAKVEMVIESKKADEKAQ